MYFLGSGNQRVQIKQIKSTLNPQIPSWFTSKPSYTSIITSIALGLRTAGPTRGHAADNSCPVCSDESTGTPAAQRPASPSWTTCGADCGYCTRCCTSRHRTRLSSGRTPASAPGKKGWFRSIKEQSASSWWIGCVTFVSRQRDSMRWRVGMETGDETRCPITTRWEERKRERTRMKKHQRLN